MLWLWRFSSSLCLWDRSFCVNISAPSFIPPHRITKFAFKYLDKKTADVLFFLLLLLLLLLHIILHLICISDSSSLHETQHDYLLTSCLVPRDWLFLRLRSLDAENMAVSNWSAIQPNSLFLLLLSNSRRKREKKGIGRKAKKRRHYYVRSSVWWARSCLEFRDESYGTILNTQSIQTTVGTPL